MKRRYLVLDAFSGAGGFSRGFEDGGFEVAVAIENDPPVSKTYKANFPDAYLIADDVKKVNYRIIKEISGYSPGDFDVVIASPPCEPFTQANKNRKKLPIDRLYSDPIGQLYLHAIRIIGELKPKYFLIENVPGILYEDIKSSIEKEIKRIGYNMAFFNVLHSEDYGVPSRRVRVFVSNVKIEPSKEKKQVVADSLRDLPEPGSYWPPNHEAPLSISKKLQKRISKVKWGDSLIEFKGAENRRFKNLIRLNPYKIAPTVMGSSRFIHPFQDRVLTVREQARLMGFPDHHIFLGGKDKQYNMIGEAVPPPLAKVIATFLLKVIVNSPVNIEQVKD
ncbi:MAG: DNA cytosine methyltransferase [Caldisphaeraceae archaeon]|nr:DNA cytosine methyltransferase [Caldisphaeraceae archaeon]